MTNDTRSPEEIEREIERERAGLTNTLNDLQDKFSVETIARQFSDQFREHGGDIGRSVSDAVKRNPVALALTGVGLAWLMMGDKTGSGDRYDRNRDYRRDNRYDQDRYDDERVGRTGLPSRNASSSQHRARALEPQPGNGNTEPYGGYRYSRNEPSWARSADYVDESDDDARGIAVKARDAVAEAGKSVTGAASAMADGARSAGSTINDGARSAGSIVADKAKGAADTVSNAGQSVADGAKNLASTATDRAVAMQKRLAEGTETLTEEARNRVIAARKAAVQARDATASYTRQGRERAADIFEDQPLIAGALALAVGAALGAALPRTRVEDHYLGDQSDQLMDEAERIFEEEKQKLGKVAKAARDEAKSIVSEAKQNADDAAPAETAAQAVVDKAKSAGKRVIDAAETEANKQNVGDVKKS